MHPTTPKQDIKEKIRELEEEIKRLKKQGKSARASLEIARAELQQSSDRMRKTMGGIIQAMSLTIEQRDPYTAGHQRRVAKLSRAIAGQMGFAWEQIQGIRMAAAIHDLGKIHVPAEILTTPRELTENEMGIIKTHPQVGYDILKGIEFSWPIAQTVYQHHERMDGSGYPRGLSGDDILMEARILAVADVVEAMSAPRPYRMPPGIDAAFEEISQNKDTLYDAEVVGACLTCFHKKIFDYKRKPERTGRSNRETSDPA